MYNHIRKQLINHSITPNVKGFHYLLNAIAITENEYKNGNWYVKMCDIYETLAQKFNTTKYAVEHAMRDCISKSKANGITVGEYITSTADHNVFAYA